MKDFYKLGKLLIIACVVLVVLPLVVSAQQPDATTLVIGQSVDVDTLEPDNVNSRAEANVVAHMLATLYSIGDNGEIQPYLAKSYKFSADGKEITFTLNDGLTCEDGEPLTAEDVVYDFKRAADPNNKFTGNTAGFVLDAIGFVDARVDGPLEATIVMKQYQSIALGLIAEVYIHCKDSYEKMTLDETAQKVVASGPYKMVEWKRGDYFLMEKRPEFTLRPGNFDKIYWRVIPEASTRVAELIAGNVDIIANVPPDQTDAINNSGVAKVDAVQGTRRMYVGYNFKPEFATTPGGKAIQDQKVRIALQYAVDVPTICSTLLGTDCTRAASMVNPPNDNPDIKPYPYDPDMAKKLLDEAGYPAGADGVRFEVTLQAPRGRYLNDANVALAIGQYLTDVGVKTTVDIKDWSSEYVPLVRAHDMGPLFFLGTGGDTWSAIYDMSDIPSADANTNYTGWNNPEWIKLWNSLADIHDDAEQRKVTNQMLQIMHDDPPWLFLYMQPDFYGVSDRVDWTARRDEQILVGSTKLKSS